MLVSMVLYSFAIISYARSDDDPCLPINHVIIDDEWRSISYVKGPSTPSHCDATIPVTWYRVASETLGELTTFSPPLDSCGTRYPIWMDDVFPSAGATTNVKMCLRTVFSLCHSTWNIEVKDCQSFFVYHLTETSICSSAYCFDPTIITSTTDTLANTGKETSGTSLISTDTNQDNAKTGVLIGVLVAVMILIAVSAIVAGIMYKCRSNQVDPHLDFPKEIVHKVIDMPKS